MKFKDFLAREWNTLLAMAALSSLVFIYPYIPTAKSELAKERAELDEINTYIIGKEYQKAGKYLEHFVGKYPDSPVAAEAHFLLGKSLLGIAKETRFSIQVLGDAVSNLQWSLDFEIKKLRKGLSSEAISNLIRTVSGEIKRKVDDEKIRAEVKVSDQAYQAVKSFIDRRKFLYEVSLLFRDNDMLEKSREILKMPYFADEKSALLDIALTYAMEPTPVIEVDQDSNVKKDFEKYYLDKYMKVASEDEKLEGLKIKALILYIRKNYDEAYDILTGIETLTKDNVKLAPILLEKGMILLKLNELDKAIEMLKRVQNEAVETDISNRAIFYLAQAYIKKNLPLAEGLLTSGLINNNSSLAPIAYLSLGIFRYQNKKSDFIRDFKNGFEMSRNLALVTRYEVDMDQISNIIRDGWETESNMEKLQYYEPTYLALKRLYGVESVSSVNLKYLYRWVKDLADFYKKVANVYKAQADKNLTERDFQKANENIGKASEYFSKAASEYIEITKLAVPASEQAAAYKNAADMFFSCNKFDDAADKYSAYAGIMTRPASQFGKLMQAKSLKAAGRFDEAMKAYDECIRNYGKLDKFTKTSIVQKARAQIYIGNYTGAIETLKMLIDDESGIYGVTPVDEEWKEALYFSGVAHFELSKSQMAKGQTENKVELIKNSSTELINARKKFIEFLNRYALNLENGQKAHPLSLNSAYYVAISYMTENNWNDALYYFNEVVDFGKDIENILEPEQKDLLRQSYFYIGDMYFNLDKFSEARKAYEVAYRRYISEKEKLWGMIGVSRCYLKVDKVDEASIWYENAEITFENFKSAYQDAPKGFGAGFWMKMLSDLKEDIKRKKTG